MTTFTITGPRMSKSGPVTTIDLQGGFLFENMDGADLCRFAESIAGHLQSGLFAAYLDEAGGFLGCSVLCQLAGNERLARAHLVRQIDRMRASRVEVLDLGACSIASDLASMDERVSVLRGSPESQGR